MDETLKPWHLSCVLFFLARYSLKIFVPILYLECLPCHSSFIHCLTSYNTFLDCSRRCGFVDTGWFYSGISLFCCSSPKLSRWFPVFSLVTPFVSFDIFLPAHLYLSSLCVSFQSGYYWYAQVLCVIVLLTLFSFSTMVPFLCLFYSWFPAFLWPLHDQHLLNHSALWYFQLQSYS